MSEFKHVDWRRYWEDIYDAARGPHPDNAALYTATKELVDAANFPDPTKFAKRLLFPLLTVAPN